jgi:hypothetical protein
MLKYKINFWICFSTSAVVMSALYYLTVVLLKKLS